MSEEEFDEEDIWAVMKESKNTSPKSKKTRDATLTSSVPRRLLPTGSKLIPKSHSMESGRVPQQSAPVNIPDWSRVYEKKGSDGPKDRGTDADDDDDEDDDDRVPPHEWIARRLARNQISSFSVCEGVGRTLKGRDLSKVRNAVLTRTGFLE
ncbi:hypothetical protein QJS10_CPA01g00877 [Acorus calamus]|uniref:Senescence regulator n=1 Tax=Acorus calamus TaxID=4465 RepID=A0AAV9FSI6_ACOCL|nr:hypothetical protein QJS10_CPA01g00877 [Acorus calamus]